MLPTTGPRPRTLDVGRWTLHAGVCRMACALAIEALICTLLQCCTCQSRFFPTWAKMSTKTGWSGVLAVISLIPLLLPVPTPLGLCLNYSSNNEEKECCSPGDITDSRRTTIILPVVTDLRKRHQRNSKILSLIHSSEEHTSLPARALDVPIG